MEPHKHAAVIHAFADGAQIEAKVGSRWMTTSQPTFVETMEYRVKPKEHPLQHMIDAQAAGATIQYSPKGLDKWYDQYCSFDAHDIGGKYRIKHKHQDVMDAYDAGAKIQFRYSDSYMWRQCEERPMFLECNEYRVAPEVKSTMTDEQLRSVYTEKIGVFMLEVCRAVADAAVAHYIKEQK